MKRLARLVFAGTRRAERRINGILLTLIWRGQGARVGRRLNAERLVHVRWPMTEYISVGNDVYLGRGVILDITPGASLRIGHRAKLMHYSLVSAADSVVIGDDFLLAEHCSVRDSEHGTKADGVIGVQPIRHAPVNIGADVWVGRGSAVLMGSVIGDGAVIGANSVVRGTIPKAAIAVGSPAKVRKYRL